MEAPSVSALIEKGVRRDYLETDKRTITLSWKSKDYCDTLEHTKESVGVLVQVLAYHDKGNKTYVVGIQKKHWTAGDNGIEWHHSSPYDRINYPYALLLREPTNRYSAKTLRTLFASVLAEMSEKSQTNKVLDELLELAQQLS